MTERFETRNLLSTFLLLTFLLLTSSVLMAVPAAQAAAGHGHEAAGHGHEAAEHGREAVDGPEEFLDQGYLEIPIEERRTSPARIWRRGRFASVQVNVDGSGQNILGDAANEPSLAVDPGDPSRMAIGWRQFDTVSSNFRQAGWAFSADGGVSWTFPGAIDAGNFRSDPLLESDADGVFYYHSLRSDFTCDLFRSADGGATWDEGVFAFGGDKAWVAIDRTTGVGRGHLYVAPWNPSFGCCFGDTFLRSTDGGDSFDTPLAIPSEPQRGVVAVGPDGEVYVTGHGSGGFGDVLVARSSNANDGGVTPTFDSVASVDMGGGIQRATGPNPGGLLGQIWVAAHPTAGSPGARHVYLLASIDPPGGDPLEVHFVRSTDGGVTWSAPVRINDDAPGSNAWQWFATLSVAPDGRLDVTWNDSREDPGGLDSALYYSSSDDGGLTWAANQAISPTFDPLLGFPQQNKIGDYNDMESENAGAHVAYAATLNGEQDVFYVFISSGGLFADGFESGDTSAWSATQP